MTVALHWETTGAAGSGTRPVGRVGAVCPDPGLRFGRGQPGL
jgi:hypothetical protein